MIWKTLLIPHGKPNPLWGMNWNGVGRRWEKREEDFCLFLSPILPRRSKGWWVHWKSSSYLTGNPKLAWFPFCIFHCLPGFFIVTNKINIQALSKSWPWFWNAAVEARGSTASSAVNTRNSPVTTVWVSTENQICFFLSLVNTLILRI